MFGTHVLVLVTVPSIEEAEKIARKLIVEKLAACVNIVPGLKSLFWWEGKMDEAGEYLLLIKSRLDKMKEVVEAVERTHSYTVPEVIAIPIIAGNKSYIEWIDQTIGKT